MIINCINPPQNILKEPDAYVHLGLLYLASVLEKRGHKVKYIDLSKIPLNVARNLIPPADAHLFSITSAVYDDVKFLCSWIKGYKVVGGIHPTLFPEETLKDMEIDCVVRNEGELVIGNVVEKKIKGIVEGKPTENLDDLPFPARHLVDIEVLRNKTEVHGKNIKGPYGSTLISSRGCPFSCKFCCNSHSPSAIRFRSAYNVIQEIREIIEKYNIRNFRFVDDNFTMNRARVFEMCELFKPLDISYIFMSRTDVLDDKMLKALKESGCHEINVGAESGSQRMLDLMDKRTNVKRNIKAIKRIKKHGIRCKTFILSGFPGETQEDIELTKDFLEKAQPDAVTGNIFVPLPGCDVYLNPERYGYTKELVHDKWKNYYFTEENEPHIKEFKEWLKKEEWKQ